METAQPLTESEIAEPLTPSLPTLPDELKYLILTHLDVPSAIRLRFTCRLFYSFIRQPSHSDWLLIEREPYFIARNLIACGGCCRLRKAEKFSYHMRTAPVEIEWHTRLDIGGRSFTVEPAMQVLGFRDPLGAGGKRAGERFCNECGRRNLLPVVGERTGRPAAEFRYKMGQIWDEEGVNWVRCVNCENIELAPERGDLGVCRWCYEVMVKERDEVAEGSRMVGLKGKE